MSNRDVDEQAANEVKRWLKNARFHTWLDSYAFALSFSIENEPVNFEAFLEALHARASEELEP